MPGVCGHVGRVDEMQRFMDQAGLPLPSAVVAETSAMPLASLFRVCELWAEKGCPESLGPQSRGHSSPVAGS